MNKLSDKIRIVSSDGKPVDKPETKSTFKKAKGLFAGNKKKPTENKQKIIKDKNSIEKEDIRKEEIDVLRKEQIEPVFEESNIEPVKIQNNKVVIGKDDSDSISEESNIEPIRVQNNKEKDKSGEVVTNRLKGLLGKDRKKIRGNDKSKKSKVERSNRDISQPTGGQNIDTNGQPVENPFKDLREREEKKTATPLLIGIIVTLTIIGIGLFIYLFSSSAMAAVQVEPKPIENTIHKDILEGDLIPTEQDGELEDIKEAKSDEEKDIVVDTPQDKENLENIIVELEEEIEDARLKNSDLGEANKKLTEELNQAKEALDVLKVEEESRGAK